MCTNQPMVHRLSALIPLAAVGLALSVPTNLTPVQAAPSSCPTPMQGRYAVMGMGVQSGKTSNTPTAHVLEERWLAGGKLQGTLVERVGRSERQASYSGQARMSSACVLELERTLPWGRERSEVVLDGKGRPLYSINRNAGTVITSRWLPMAPGSCQAADLNGLVLSSQVGLSWRNGGWSPNAVLQREHWSNGSVKGLALASYSGMGETAGYSGQLKLDPSSCWGSLSERDALGVNYNYRALLVKGRSGARGYLYLQSDLDDLTAGWLVRD
jgi:hypothetical protein